MQIAKSSSEEGTNPWTFRTVRIDPSRQVVMKEAILAGPGFFSGPKMKKNVKHVSKSAKIRFHPISIVYFPFKEPIGAPYWYPF